MKNKITEKEQAIMNLESVKTKCNNVKNEMEKELKKLYKDRAEHNSDLESEIITDITQLNNIDKYSKDKNERKIILLEKSISNFKYENYEEYRVAAKEYLDIIEKEIESMENLSREAMETMNIKLKEAEELKDKTLNNIVPGYREEIDNLLNIVSGTIYSEIGHIKSGKYVLNKIREKLNSKNDR